MQYANIVPMHLKRKYNGTHIHYTCIELHDVLKFKW